MPVNRKPALSAADPQRFKSDRKREAPVFPEYCNSWKCRRFSFSVYFCILKLIVNSYNIFNPALQDLAKRRQRGDVYVVATFQMIKSTLVEVIGIYQFIC